MALFFPLTLGRKGTIKCVAQNLVGQKNGECIFVMSSWNNPKKYFMVYVQSALKVEKIVQHHFFFQK